jgi:type IV secretion system protein TrbL
VIDISACQLTPVACQLAPNVGQDVANAAASAFLNVVASGLSVSADWLVGHVVALVNLPSPDLSVGWFAGQWARMELVASVIVLPVLMAATFGAVLRQDLKRLGRVWGVGLPVAVVAGAGGSTLVGLALQATDELSARITTGGSGSVSDQLAGTITAVGASSAPAFVKMVIFTLMIVGAVLIWLELLIRMSAVYLAVFFMPVSLVSYIWPATAHLTRRMVEIITALILSKFVIVGGLALGEAALVAHSGPGSLDAAISGCAILLIAGFAPFTLLRLAPVAEAAAISHLEGLSRRPVRGAATAAATLLPVAQTVMAAASRTPDGGGVGPVATGGSHRDSSARPVSAVPLPERPPDYPLPPEVGGGDV